MGPIVKECQDKLSGRPIAFVTFDFTSDETTAASKRKAEEYGVAELYAEHAPNTGFVLLYDTETKQVVQKLGANQQVAEWMSIIDNALGS